MRRSRRLLRRSCFWPRRLFACRKADEANLTSDRVVPMSARVFRISADAVCTIFDHLTFGMKEGPYDPFALPAWLFP